MSREESVAHKKMETYNFNPPEKKEVVEEESTEPKTVTIVETKTVINKGYRLFEDDDDDDDDEEESETPMEEDVSHEIEVHTMEEDVGHESEAHTMEENSKESETPIEENRKEGETAIEENSKDSETAVKENSKDSETAIKENSKDSETAITENSKDSETAIKENSKDSETAVEEMVIEKEDKTEESDALNEKKIDESETVMEEEVDEEREAIVEEESKEKNDKTEVIDESGMANEGETVESETINEDDQSSSKYSRELKALLELSKEAKLETNIIHKRKSVEPKKLFNKDNLLDDSAEKEGATYKPDATTVSGKRRSLMPKMASNPKRTRKEPLLDLSLIKRRKDAFCWRCHKNVVTSQQSSIGGIYCDTCPRSYHLKCVKQSGNPPWQCPECVKILTAENIKTRSPSLRSMDLNHLCSLLKFALKRMIQGVDSGPFIRPVNEKECPDYKKYIIHPMDLSMIQNNIENNVYGSTNAFEADTKWILHNSIIYNSYQSKLTSTAKYIERICKQEMIEIENCSNCYLNANTKESWFVEVCPRPHLLIWAKLKGFPYWPAKAMSTNRFGMVDVRFFGAHDRAWVSHKDCYLYSQTNPNMHQMRKYNINECILEVDVYIENLRKEFGVFRFAPFKAPFDPEVDHLPLFLPKYVSPSGNRRVFKRVRSESKSSISSVKSLSSVARDLSKEIESDEDNNRTNGISPENSPGKGTDHETAKPEIEKTDPEEEKTNNNLEKTEMTEESKATNQDLKITDKLLNKLAKPDETTVEKKEDIEKKEVISTNTPVEKLDYEENDLLEVLYSEELDGPKPDSTKKNNKVKINGVTKENSLITGIKDNINKALAISKNIQENLNSTENTKTSRADEKKGKDAKVPELITINKNDITKVAIVGYQDKTEPCNISENVSNVDISIDNVARGFVKIKATNEINKTINVIRPDLLLKSKKGPVEKKKVVSSRRNTNKSDRSDDDLEIIDWYMDDFSDMNGEVSKKRKLSLDSIDGNAKKHIQDEVIIIKCESKAEEEAAKKKHMSLLEKAKNPSEESLEMRTEIFHALKLFEKGIEQEKPKVHEIRTRSKTEEKFGNSGFTIKQRARKSFPNTKSPSAYRGKKDALPIPPLISTSRILKQITSPSLLVNNPPIVVSSGVSSTQTSQSLVLVPAPLLFQSGPNSGPILAMVTPGNSPYTFVSQGSTFINGNINLAIGKDKIQGNSNHLAIEGKPESSTSIMGKITVGSSLAECPKPTSTNNLIGDKVPIAEAPSVCEIHVSNETGVGNKSTGIERVPLTIDNDSLPLPKGRVVDKQQFNSTVSEPLNPTEFNILNGIIQESVPKTFTEILSRPPPTLKPRPPGPLSTQFDTGVPSSAGPWTARINSISHRLSDYLRGMLIETLNDVSSTTDNPEALITTLQLEVESLKAKHAEEILEIKKNVNSLLQDIQKSIIEEKEKVIIETRASCETETIRRVEEAKSKQWCANCMKEAQFYCCWNTSYCDYPCQTKHWPKHMSKCTQNSQSQSGPQMGIMKGSQQILLRPVMPPKGFTGGKPLLAKPTKIIMSKTPSSIPMNMVRTSSASGITLVESRTGGYEVITNGQIVDGNKIINPPIKGIRKISSSASAISTPSSITQTASKTVILQSTKSPVMSSTAKSPENRSTEDPLAI